MAVKIHAARLLALKAAKQGRRSIPVTEVVEALNQTESAKESDTRISRGAVDSWLSGNLTRFDDHLIEAWCEYLPCTVGQLLEVPGAISFEEGVEQGQIKAVT